MPCHSSSCTMGTASGTGTGTEPDTWLLLGNPMPSTVSALLKSVTNSWTDCDSSLGLWEVGKLVESSWHGINSLSLNISTIICLGFVCVYLQYFIYFYFTFCVFFFFFVIRLFAFLFGLGVGWKLLWQVIYIKDKWNTRRCDYGALLTILISLCEGGRRRRGWDRERDLSLLWM